MPNPSKACATRLTRELRAFRSAPPPLAPSVYVDEKDLLEWFILLQGAPDSPYEGGWYVMRIKFKHDYPFKAPAVSMITPNGRFAENQSVCMSMTEWHQESWNPAWSASCIVTGFISFMTTDEQTSGGVRTTDAEKRRLAAASLEWNAKNANLVQKFPELADPEKLHALKMK
ncbi:Ubiquitin-conjugating enzyme, E2 [Ostreococcus tauri]|uniref:Ubiquitin-conjugating enzyme, E2 n=1 Tax=Ostreococcus tauri TaxID=70448 RepID=A0A096PBL9_OSTTA|nr:Ubiquitin-conjugating enzyme, E2 [Ostreococcus tauri]OUS45833.1 ubiquitin-protein ligase [Ostreococcus tauri]CEG01989.1 Ubiquitin-conjugating enzyme, E2 [Ostreococcus tauri]|eukprot:XP_022841291.1 Ubiquitin-conjugating enzyme, E2 [Ostreococcus tauri]